MTRFTIDQAFDAAVARQHAGRLQEAEAIYRQIISLHPAHAESLHNLAVIANQTGRRPEAIELLHQAIAIRPDYATAHSNLADLLREQGQVDEAIASYMEAIRHAPEVAQTHCNLGIALKQAGQIDQAIAAYRRALSLKPDFAEAHNNLANALRECGQLQEAIAGYSKSIEHRPGWAVPWMNLGHLLRAQGDFERAGAAFQRAAELQPDHVAAHACVAAMMAELQRFDEAAAALEKAETLEPTAAAAYEAGGIILLRSGRGEEAVERFRKVVEVLPDSQAGWDNLGKALRQTGRFTEAADCFRRTLAAPAAAAQNFALLASVGAPISADLVERAQAEFEDPTTPPHDRSMLGFALGKWFDDADRFDEAFAHYTRANQLALEQRHAAGMRYSPEQFEQQVDQTIARFTPDFFSRTRAWGNASDLPVFIVGMPRSGTSIVEQIAASHSEVFGAGELLDMSHFATALRSVEWNADVIGAMSQKHLRRLRTLGGSARRVIDKMPSNVEQLGLIATLFPAARVILCRRDSRDTCLSCFFQQFTSANLFSFDLVQCAQHHLHTDRLISHWLKVLPLRILEVRYETLVAEQENQTRRIIRFLDLPWEPACLQFYQTNRTVQTASDWQVRQPIYTRSVGRWRNYEKHLAPMIAALSTNG